VTERGRIASIGSSAKNSVPTADKVLELSDFSVIRGLVGMHEHTFYPSGDSAASALAAAVLLVSARQARWNLCQPHS
jgi:imidazolonepropionase-like amidohydrolase